MIGSDFGTCLTRIRPFSRHPLDAAAAPMLSDSDRRVDLADSGPQLGKRRMLLTASSPAHKNLRILAADPGTVADPAHQQAASRTMHQKNLQGLLVAKGVSLPSALCSAIPLESPEMKVLPFYRSPFSSDET